MANFGIGLGLAFGIGIPLQYPLVNGFAPSWASIEFRPQVLGGAPLPVVQTIQSIDYSVKNNSKEVLGTNPNPISVTRGQIANTAKCKMLLYEMNQFLLALAAVDITGLGAYGDVFFDVQVQYAETGGPIITDTLHGCRVYDVSQTSSVGPDAIVCELDLRPLQILRNGMPMSSAQLSAFQFP